MKTHLFRSLVTGTLLALPFSASVAQDPSPARATVAYSEEELDNLVAPIALYPDALLAQILIAATFPEQVEVASRWVREHGTRGIDDQNWDLSVKSVAHYPPVINMLANQEDWSTALGQAYAAQSGEVMDAVQRLRELAREQGNLVSTPEHTVTVERERIVIVPANPRVIYVPTYDPEVIFFRPAFGFGFHTGYFSFGIGFPIGSWLSYDVDWYARRVYYDGWYGGGWRTYARPYIHVTPVYVHPRYRSINININIFSRRVNYVNLDRRYRYVHRTASWERHDRDWGRYEDRNGWGNDRRGPVGDRGGRDGGRPAGRGDRNEPNDRIGNRVATFDDYRPDRGGRQPDTRDAEPRTTAPATFGTIDKRREPPAPLGRNDNKGYGSQRAPEVRSQPRPQAPVFSAPSKSESRKAGPSPSRPQAMRVQPSRPSSGGASLRSGSSRPSSGGKVKSSGGGGGGGGSRGAKGRNK